MDQKDLFAMFLHLRKTKSEDEIFNLLETYEISKLDISRLYRYLDKYSTHDDTIGDDESDDVSVSSSV